MDSRVRIISDQPWDNEKKDDIVFSFDAYAKVLADVSLNQDNDTPLCVLVQGEWGSGKTSLFRKIQAKLAESLDDKSEDVRKVKSIWFNAWKYQKADPVMAGLLSALLQEIAKGDPKDKNGSITAEAKAWFEKNDGPTGVLLTLFPLLLNLVTGGGFSDSESNVQKVLDKGDTIDIFQQAFLEINKRWLKDSWRDESRNDSDGSHCLAIMVDDLDRCNEEQIKNVLEAIKLCLDFEGVVFYLAMDGRQLNTYLKELDNDRSKEAFDKFVQVFFEIPKPSHTGFDIYLKEILKGHPLLEHLPAEAQGLLLTVLDRNPRTAKRHLNDVSVWLSVFREVYADEAGDDLTNYIAFARYYFLLRLTVQRAAPTSWEGISRSANTFLSWLNEINKKIQDEETLKEDDPDRAIIESLAKQVLDVLFKQQKKVGFTKVVHAMVDFEFKLGSGMPLDSQSDNFDFTLQHNCTELKVNIFAYPVAQGLYKRLMPNTSHFNYVGSDELPAERVDELPVERVTWYDAVKFCNALSQEEGLEAVYKIDKTNVTIIEGKNGYRLPTADEWEKACMAGQADDPYGPLEKIAWYKENSEGRTHPVGKKEPNRWKLHDMIGNVWEWCWDKYDDTASARIVHGGSYNDDVPDALSASYRRWQDPNERLRKLGFRCVRSSR